MTADRDASLRATLDRLYGDFNYPDSATDPIQIVRRFDRPADREVVGFCAAALAFGRVASVLQSIERLLTVMGPHPADYVRASTRARTRRLFPIWFTAGSGEPTWWRCSGCMRQMIERSGSLERFFVEGLDPAASDVSDAIDSFSTRALGLDLRRAYGRVPARAGVCYFFPRPSNGSACKRVNLFLRWMVRRDALDLGVWSSVSPAQLVVPLDTHIIRVGRCLKLTRYVSPGWAMARDITASLRRLDPDDPVKYDFAMCHLGMMKACGFQTRGATTSVRCGTRAAHPAAVDALVRSGGHIDRTARHLQAGTPSRVSGCGHEPRHPRAASSLASAQDGSARDAARRLRSVRAANQALYTAAVWATIRSTVKRSLTRANPASPIVCSPGLVGEQPHDRAGERRRVARRHQQTVDAVFDDLGNAAGARRHDRRLAGHGVEQRGAEALGHRAHREHVEAFDAAQDVGAESRQQHVLLEVVLVDQAFEVFAQLPFAENDEPGVRDLTHDQVRRFDEIALSLVRHQRRDVADERRSMRQPQRFVHVHGGAATNVGDVDALVHRHRAIGRHAIGQQHLSDRIGRGDEAIDLAVLPSGQRVVLQMKVDPPGGHERWRRSRIRSSTTPAPPSPRRAGRAHESRRGGAA